MVLAAAGCLCAGAQQTPIFEFHSGFWVNLHQFLYSQAKDEKAPPAGSAAWQEAVGYYRREVATHDHLDDDMAALNNRLSRAERADLLPGSGVEARLAGVLEKAAGEYRKTWWPEHEAANRAWTAAVRPLLEKYGAAMKRDIAAAFRTEWPREPIRTEVAVKASWAGAYTTTHPTLITISSTDPQNQGLASVEILFHEASHSLDEKVNAALSQELEAQKALFQRRAFGHAVLFYTAGEAARRNLGDYQPFGIKNGILERGWPGALAVLEKDWKPYLEGTVPFAEAVRAVVRDYGVPKK